jgi:dTDP-4-amino-4,6-dideoxygalactose transaminase
MRKEVLVFGQPKIEQPEIDEVVDTLKSGWIGTGPKVKKFEQDFAKYKGVKDALAVNSCTSALHLVLAHLGINARHEVIVPTMTFSGTAEAVLYTGATLVLADCDETGNIDPRDIWKKITARTKAIIVVHYTGRPVDMDSIMQLAERHDLYVIEDCAHAIETEYKGKKAGTIGDFGCFSFYATKNVTTGDGGMIISNRWQLDTLRPLSLHGMTKDAYSRREKEYESYLITKLGYKYNLTDIMASLGIHQLKDIEKNWLRRQEIWNKYNEAFSKIPNIEIPKSVENGRHSYHLYTLLVPNRNIFCKKLAEKKIGIGIHYKALHLHPFYKQMGWKQWDFPMATSISFRTVSLPLSPKMTDEDVNDVIEAVKYASIGL